MDGTMNLAVIAAAAWKRLVGYCWNDSNKMDFYSLSPLVFI